MNQNPKRNIPEIIYQDLVELFGQEEADEIEERVGFNYKHLSFIIIAAKFKRRFGLTNGTVFAIIMFLYLLSIII